MKKELVKQLDQIMDEMERNKESYEDILERLIKVLTDEISKLSKEYSGQFYYVCPDCGKGHVLDFVNNKWTTNHIQAKEGKK